MKKLLKLINLLQNSYSPTTVVQNILDGRANVCAGCSKRVSIEQIFEPRVIVLCLGDIAGSTHLAKTLIISTSAYANIRPHAYSCKCTSKWSCICRSDRRDVL